MAFRISEVMRRLRVQHGWASMRRTKKKCTIAKQSSQLDQLLASRCCFKKDSYFSAWLKRWVSTPKLGDPLLLGVEAGESIFILNRACPAVCYLQVSASLSMACAFCPDHRRPIQIGECWPCKAADGRLLVDVSGLRSLGTELLPRSGP